MIGLVLVITNDREEARRVTTACDALGVGVHVADSCEAAMVYLNSGSAELVVGNFQAVERMRQLRPGLRAIVKASKADGRQIIESMKHGVLDYFVQSTDHETLVKRLGEALRIAAEAEQPQPRTRTEESEQGVRLVGQSPAMQEVYRQVGMIAPREINVLITGESGTGKELVAQAILEHSPRADKPFMAINCAAIPDALLESELFGHEKGAFTGADARRVGKFEQCDGGTVFLDEIGDLPLPTQGKLLRVLQDRSFQRVGGNKTIRCDVRIIAATHQPLEQMIAGKKFRQDLYYRLNVATIHLPALREREVDPVLLAHYFVDRIGRQMNSHVRAFAPETVAALLAYPWPGNVRELENVVRSSLAMARGAVFRPEFLPEHIRPALPQLLAKPGPGAQSPAKPAHTQGLETWVDAVLSGKPSVGRNTLFGTVSEVEKLLIKRALVRADGQLVKTAKLLGISRTTLRKKMNDYGIVVKQVPGER